MSFFIKATIRDFATPRHRLSCSAHLWRRIVTQLADSGEGCHEAGVFLLGIKRDQRCEVQDAVFYDELDPHAYDSGVCILHGDAFAKLWSTCRDRNLTVVADAHTHPGEAFQSFSDRTNPMIARAGHIAIIIPDYARQPLRPSLLGIYEYQGEHEWIDRGCAKSPGFLYTGLWS